MLCMSVVVLLAVSAPAAAQRNRYEVTLHNESDITIQEVHVSSIYDGSWERDLLGNYTLRPGYRLTVEVPSGRWDFRFVDRHGDSCILHDVIVNRNADVEVTNEWLESYCTLEMSRR
jgi:hypothetical protein